MKKIAEKDAFLSTPVQAFVVLVLALLAGTGCQRSGQPTAWGGEPDRTVLPLAEPNYPPITELDVRKAPPPPRFEVKAPQGAPNVIVILLDNLGYGARKRSAA